jgi:hypothetical protein
VALIGSLLATIFTTKFLEIQHPSLDDFLFLNMDI